MEYVLCKMSFITEVHFGRNFLSDNEYCCYADTLFSALCHEYIKIYGTLELPRFVESFQQGHLLISDAFPYINDNYYLPTPMIWSDKLKLYSLKEIKKVPYIPAIKIEEFLDGKLDVLEEYDTLCHLGKSSMRVKASIHGLEEANPYWVGGYRFQERNGLYFIVGYSEQRAYDQLKQILTALSYTGIGGKISSGFGAFELQIEDIPDTWKNHLVHDCNKQNIDRYMTLSISLPQNRELDESLVNACYQIVRRGGFVASLNKSEQRTDYGKEQRKQDLYVFQSGSCFENRYEGDIYDVSNGNNHPVYRYAKPMFWRLSI